MKVKKVVANVEGCDMKSAKQFYQEVFGMNLLMDIDWIVTFGGEESMPVQISVASEGGSGTEVPRLSIEVDDLEAALIKVRENKIKIEYGPAVEPWGVKRFYVRDPFGTLINVLQHT